VGHEPTSTFAIASGEKQLRPHVSFKKPSPSKRAQLCLVNASKATSLLKPRNIPLPKALWRESALPCISTTPPRPFQSPSSLPRASANSASVSYEKVLLAPPRLTTIYIPLYGVHLMLTQHMASWSAIEFPGRSDGHLSPARTMYISRVAPWRLLLAPRKRKRSEHGGAD
jgi:hypothetical protein